MWSLWPPVPLVDEVHHVVHVDGIHLHRDAVVLIAVAGGHVIGSWVYVRQYCAKIDEAARNRMELIMPELAKQYDVAEQLKAENQMEWVRQMNACKAQAEEVVKAELIYD